jgi:cytochrome c peroxidase
VRQPLLNPDEMGNRDPRQIADKVAASAYVDDFRREFGGGFDDADKVLASLGTAVEAFLLSPAMAPFSSKYDAYIGARRRWMPKRYAGSSCSKIDKRAVATPVTR